MSGMRAHIAQLGRLRSSSLTNTPPRPTSQEYSPDLARAAASILFRSPIPSSENRPVYILNAAALPDSREADYDSLLPYVLARLPEEDDLVKGYEYEVVFFAGDSDGSATTRKNRPGWGWFLQAYHVLTRAMRKRLQKLYIVHEKAWVRILTEVFSTIVSPKFRRKIIHASTLTNLALHIPIEDLLIPPSTYLYDRRVSDDIYAPYATARRAFVATQPFPVSSKGGTRFPRVLRETTGFLLMEENITNEGLFRVPPHSKLRDVLKEAYDRGQKFIIFKDNEVTIPIPPYPHAEHMDEIIAEVDPKDAYGVYMAAALIKAWYADLRQPIFPSFCYRDLKRLYGDPDDVPELDRLTDLISPSSEWSFLPAISREIIVRHLLPTLSAVAARQEQNKMTAENLAVCFAPALLCGPDQLEDAKMSSIVRRIMTEAIEQWSHGLREACGEKEGTLQEQLQLPQDENEWEDPAEGRKGHSERDSIDENLITGIILQDNDEPAEPQQQQQQQQQPPPLPPRSMKVPPASTSGRSSIESVTKRKPAPPLQVPPRYSAVVSDGPHDSTDSPSSYAAVTDGFAPRSAPADEKGTNHHGDSPVTPQIVLPERKALTAEQIEHAETTVAKPEESTRTEGRGMALPGLAELYASEAVKRKAVPLAAPLPEADTVKAENPPTYTEREVASPSDVKPPVKEFRRPSLPLSANRNPNITSLARPVFPPPMHPVTNRPASKSTSLPVPGPKPRTPSPGLMQRMPSFDTSRNSPPSLAPPSGPRKLNPKKQSVDDLRRLYEERAGTAKTLVAAGKPN